jgi:hypothetical protein
MPLRPKKTLLFPQLLSSYLFTDDLYSPVQNVFVLMREDPLRGQVGGGWALEIESFLGPVKKHRADRRVPLGPKKMPLTCSLGRKVRLPRELALMALSQACPVAQ